MAVQVFCPAAAAVGEVLTMGDQPLVQVAGEQRYAVGAGVVPEEMAGDAGLVAAAGAEQVLIEPGPLLDRLAAGGLQTSEGDQHHGDSCVRTSELAGLELWRQRLTWRCRAAALLSAPRCGSPERTGPVEVALLADPIGCLCCQALPIRSLA